MKHAATQSLFAYWDRLRGTRAAPERADIDPAEIRDILADTFLLEFEDRGSGRTPDLPVRLSGTRVNALFSIDIKGHNFSNLWSEAQRPEIVDLVRAVLDDARPVVAGVEAAPPGCLPMNFELLLLPLRHHGKTHSRLLGALSPAGVPSWLGLLAVGSLTLKSQRMLDKQNARSATPSLLRRSASAVAARRGRFLVYDGGRREMPEFQEVEVR